MDNKRAWYWDKTKRPRPAIYHLKAFLDKLKGDRETDHASRFGGMHVRFGGENRGIQAAEYHGSIGRFIFSLNDLWGLNKLGEVSMFCAVSVCIYEEIFAICMGGCREHKPD